MREGRRVAWRVEAERSHCFGVEEEGGGRRRREASQKGQRGMRRIIVEVEVEGGLRLEIVHV